jgi:hypothetical protein
VVRDQNPQVLGAPDRPTHRDDLRDPADPAYRVQGHLLADIDPLGYQPGTHPELGCRITA